MKQFIVSIMCVWMLIFCQKTFAQASVAYATSIDLTTASFSGDTLSVVTRESIPQSTAFNLDGSKMYIVGIFDDQVFEYTLSVRFDVTTAAVTDSFDVSNEESNPRGMSFNNNGSKMYIVGNSSDRVYEYTLSVPFAVSSATIRTNLSVADHETNPRHKSSEILTFQRINSLFIIGRSQGCNR